jgi:ketosteroid isomerase-like protein
MSRETLELVTRAVSAVNRRPKPDFDTVNELFHEDHVFVSVVANRLGEGELRGGAGYKSFLDNMAEVMPFEMEVEGAVDIAPDVVLVVSTVHTRAALTGIEDTVRMWTVITVANGRLVRTEVHLDPGEALRAAGVPS